MGGTTAGTSARAVTPGTDLARHARALLKAHDEVLSGGRPSEPPRDLVVRSWRRVMSLGLEPDGHNFRRQPSPEELGRRREESPLSQVVDQLRGVLTSVADAAHFLMVVTDADGVILWREGSTRVRTTADRLGFVEGVPWTEREVGTNAIGTALAEAAPVELFSAEHFEHQQHPWYCTAAPLHDPRTGELLGVVDVSGPAMTLHPAVGALVETAVKLGEASLWRQHTGGGVGGGGGAAPGGAAARGPHRPGPAHGWVAHHSGIAVRDRIEVPRADRPVAVPGLGLCLPERLADGWLVRPRTGSTAVRARLGVDGVIEIQGEDTWRATLTPRHAQILRLLAAAGRTGLSAGQLSAAVFGDTDHVVTARAEVSRLRRVLGALVATNPYRLADGVSLTVE